MRGAGSPPGLSPNMEFRNFLFVLSFPLFFPRHSSESGNPDGCSQAAARLVSVERF